MTASELFHAGKLGEAVTAALGEVRDHPTDTGRRVLLAELLCLSGDLERADNQLDVIGHGDPKALPWAATFRQLIRGEQARQDFHAAGRPPEFLGRPEGSVELLLRASVRLREGAAAEAAALLEQAEEARPRPRGSCDGRPFDDFRDLDDRLAGVLEVITSSGTYYWIPLDRVESIELPPPERARDLLWRRAHLIVRDGPDGEVYLPALYPGAAAEADEALRLGRQTEWRGGDGEPVRGAGQRMFLVGDDARPIVEIRSVTFDGPPGE